MKELLELVREGKATDTVCCLTKNPIMPLEGMYVLYGENYHESVDIDALIKEQSEGRYTSKDEAYSADIYYWTENYGPYDVYENIIDQEYYYDEQGRKIELDNKF